MKISGNAMFAAAAHNLRTRRNILYGTSISIKIEAKITHTITRNDIVAKYIICKHDYFFEIVGIHMI